MNARKKRKGNALLEAAFGLTVFLMLFSGVMDFGRLNWERNLLSHAVREGVRYAIVHGQASLTPASARDVAAAVKRQAVGLDPNRLSITTSWSPDNQPGSVVRVRVTYPYSPVMPFIPTGTLSLKATSQMVISQ